MKVGFTGTRNGMNHLQTITVLGVLENHNITEIHHGDCIGADSDFHDMGRLFDYIKIVIHPPSKNDLRAYKDGDEVKEPDSYFARNRNIVNTTDFMIATPPTMEHLTRGGTWYTIDYSIKVGKKCYVCYPDGTMEIM